MDREGDTEKMVDRKKEKDKTRATEQVVRDTVNHPPHYNQHGIECIDAIQACTGDGFKYYLQGNILKYLWRYDYKNGVEDLRKARWYEERLMKFLLDNQDAV